MSFVCQSYVLICNPYVIRILLVCARMSFVCNSYVFVNHLCVLVCHSYVSRMFLYVIRMSLVCTRMSSACHVYTRRSLAYHSNVIRMSLVCTRMSPVCHSYVLVCHSYVLACHPYVTRVWFYHEPFLMSNHEGVETTVENNRDSAVSILNYS